LNSDFVGVLKYQDFAFQDLHESIEKFPWKIGCYLGGIRAGNPYRSEVDAFLLFMVDRSITRHMIGIERAERGLRGKLDKIQLLADCYLPLKVR